MARAAFIATALLASGTEAGAGDDLARTHLPGFTLKLPAGQVVSTSNTAFAGRHEVRLPKPSLLEKLNPKDQRIAEPRVVVTWNQHGQYPRDWYKQLLGTLVKGLPDENSGVLLEQSTAPGVWISIVGDATAPLGYGSVGCERGFNVDVIVAVTRDVDQQFALTQQIAESVVCELTDANRRRQEAATHLPKEFLRVRSEQNPTYVTLTGERLAVSMTPRDVLRDPKTFNTVMIALTSEALNIPVGQLTATTMPVESATRKSGLVQLDTKGQGTMFVGALWCPKSGVTVISIYSSESPRADRARALLAAIGCPGETGDSPPDAGPALKDACSRGNHAACQMVEEFAL